MDTHTLTPDVPCEVVPKHDATADQLKALGAALAEWGERELPEGGLLRSIDQIVITELLGGGDPTEVVFAVLYGDDDEDVLTITRRAPSHSDPSAAEQLVVECVFRGPGYDRRRAVASLRRYVPADLVEDVMIGGRSWNQPT